MEFKLHSEYQPTGDQPQAIEALVKGFKEGNQFETFTRGYGLWQDFHHGQCHPAVTEAHPHYCPQ